MSKKTNHPKRIDVCVNPGEDEEAKVAETYLRPESLSAATIKSQYQKTDLVNVNAIIGELSLQIKKVSEGDLSTPEAMLVSQAHTLDHMFATLILKAQKNMGEHFSAAEKLMKLALKTQSQCRMTIEALAEMKNPKPYIQNNKAQYQQVNNGPRVENLKQSNELLEDNSNEWMDTGASQAPIRNDKELEAVGAEHRAKDG